MKDGKYKLLNTLLYKKLLAGVVILLFLILPWLVAYVLDWYAGGIPKKEFITLYANLIAGIGALGAVLIAVFLDSIKNWLNPIIVDIVPLEEDGDIISSHIQRFSHLNPVPLCVYHLTLINKNPSRILENCNVLLVNCEKEINGEFKPTSFFVPRLMHWSPKEANLDNLIITDYQVFDFCVFYSKHPGNNGGRLEPLMRHFPSNFLGYAEKNQRVRYHLELKAKNYSQKKPFIFEVYWKDDFEIREDMMKEHVSITRIK